MTMLTIKTPNGKTAPCDQDTFIQGAREGLRTKFPTLVDQASDAAILRAATYLLRQQGGNVQRKADEDYLEVDGVRVPRSQLAALIKAQIAIETAKAERKLTGRID